MTGIKVLRSEMEPPEQVVGFLVNWNSKMRQGIDGYGFIRSFLEGAQSEMASGVFVWG